MSVVAPGVLTRLGPRGSLAVASGNASGVAKHCSNLTVQACAARPTQMGVRVKLGLTWADAKGWCVMAMQPISQGTFVCEYAGEYLTYKAAQQRLAQYDQQTDSPGHALLVGQNARRPISLSWERSTSTLRMQAATQPHLSAETELELYQQLFRQPISIDATQLCLQGS
eukprot:gene6932-7150_t